LLAFFYFVTSIILLQAAVDAIAAGLTFFILFAVLFVNGQVTLRVWYGALTLIALDFA